LHNLGVQFSLAVSGKQWAKALETGMEIIRDFPNSRMAEEIREKIDALKTHAQQKA
jgi:outer membrane protein assembly factor BamD (BamD/ComL family)